MLTPVEFWTFNGTRVGAVAGTELTSGDGLEHYVPALIDQGWDHALNINRYLSLFGFAAAGINYAPPWTVSLWEKRASTANYTGQLFGWMNSAAIEVQDVWTAFGRSVRGYINGVQKCSRTLTKSTAWTHFVVAYEAAAGGTFHFWVDGAKTSYAGVGLPTATPIEFQQGRSAVGNNSVRDAVGYWNVVLSDEVVTELYNAGVGWEFTPGSSTLKQHLVVGPTGLIQPVGACVVVPGWV